MKQLTLKWVAVGVTATLVVAYTVTYALVGRFLNEDWQPNWDLEDEDF